VDCFGMWIDERNKQQDRRKQPHVVAASIEARFSGLYRMHKCE